MHEFYSSYYAAVEHSAAHHVFCERVFDIDLCQHGFADRAQLDLLLDVTELHEGQHALDLGCGNGRITEYLSDRSGGRASPAWTTFPTRSTARSSARPPRRTGWRS